MREDGNQACTQHRCIDIYAAQDSMSGLCS
jgi:hypothetical protein